MKFSTSQIVLLASIILIGFFGIVGYQMHLDNLPQTNITQVEMPSADIVEAVWTKLLTNDSLIRSLYINLPKFDSTVVVPIYYEYQDIGVVPNGKTSYWFFIGTTYAPNGKTIHSMALEMPSSYFDFDAAGAKLMSSREGVTTCFIDSFYQISEASYLSYRKYANKY